MSSPTIARDLELEARLLVRWMGWRWMRDRSRNLCTLRPPFEGSEWESSPGFAGGAEGEARHLELLATVPSIAERFSDWAENGATRFPYGGENFHRAEFGMPPLSTSLDSCSHLKAALLRRELNVLVNCYNSFHVAAWYVLKDPIIKSSVWIYAKIENDSDETIGSSSIKAGDYMGSIEAMAICQAADSIK